MRIKKIIPLIIPLMFLTGWQEPQKRSPTHVSLSETISKGHIIDYEALKLISVGSRREQVLMNLGTPSMVSKSDKEIFYYISQKRQRLFAFKKPSIVDQIILAIHFNKNGYVEKIQNYGLKDRKNFNFSKRAIDKGKKDESFLDKMRSHSLFRKKPGPIELPGFVQPEKSLPKEKAR